MPPTFSLDESITPRFSEVFTTDVAVDRERATEMWKSFIAVLPHFKHLTDLVVQLPSGLPPGLLAAIEEHHPACRLHLWNFRFKSLQDNFTDSDERALATSPNLHSLNIMYMYRDSNGVDDHNGAAALRTIALAPNLKHVKMLGCRPASSPALHRAMGRALEEWKGFVPPIEEAREKKVKTKLESLAFVCYNNSLNCAKLEKWSAIADFSKLKVLSCAIGDKELLKQVALYETFPHLQELKLILEPKKQDDLGDWQPLVEQFFTLMNPLRSLVLSGTLHGPLLDAIADRHGATLQELALHPFADGYDMPGPPLRITAPVMEMLAAKCQRLAILNLTLRRSAGDRTESRCYEALGTLPQLRRLSLKLDCTNASAWDLKPEEDWDDFDKTTLTHAGSNPKMYNGYLKRAIINSALDETLVQEIWSVINKNRFQGKPTLESLNIHTYGGSSFGNSHPGDLMDICSHVSRSYCVTRTDKEKYGEEGSGILIAELSKERREERDKESKKHEQNMLEKWGHRGLNGSSWIVFNHLWPFQEDEDWRVKWKSWPLQRSGSGAGEGENML